MIKLQYKDANLDDLEFRLINNIKINKSSREVKYGDVTIDFTGYTVEDLPTKYQEVKLIDDDKIIYVGYVDTVTPPSFHNNYEDIFVEITLLSPMAMATLRTNTIIGTYSLEDLFNRIFEPLVNDGFEIVEENYKKDSQCTVSFGIKTIEDIMNNLSNRLNIWWYIDENKGIHINSIEYLMSLPTVQKIDENTNYRNIGLTELTPTIENNDYANVINIKNARIYTKTESTGDYIIMEQGKTIKAGDTYDFNYPIDILDTNLRVIKDDYNLTVDVDAIYLSIGGIEAYIKLDTNNNYVVSSNISFSDDTTEKLIVLQRDSFFKNLITGFKYTGGSNTTLNQARSYSSLKYSVVKFYHNEEIQSQKGRTSNTGIIEKTVDVNERWFTEKQLIDYARNLMTTNGNKSLIVELSYVKNPNLKIGDKVEIEREDFLTNDSYIVTDMVETINWGEDNTRWELELRKVNIFENYIDIFRRSDEQENEDIYNDILTAEFNEESIINKVEVNEYESE